MPKRITLGSLLQQSRELISRKLWVKILLCLFLGLITGYLLGPEVAWVSRETSKNISNWLALPGKVFLILMKMIVIPLVLSSVILGVIGSGSLKKLRFMSIRIIPYFVFTTAIAIIIGFATAFWIQPGKGLAKDLSQTSTKIQDVKTFEEKSIPDQLTSVLPSNPLGSIVDGELFQVVIFAMLLGVAILSLPKDESKTLIDLLEAIQKVSMIIVGWAMYLAPIAVFGLMAELFSQTGFDSLIAVGSYALTVTLALFLILVFYLVLIRISGFSAFQFLNIARPLQLLAFSTSSSAAVMPVTMNVAEQELKVNPSVSRFVIPLGTTINMDGTATYQGVAVLFIAQVYGLELGISQLALIVITAIGASIGTPGTPGVGTAILVSVLSSLNIPSEGILLILGIERILDMLRTSINVTGDLTASYVFDKWLGKVDFE